MGGGKGQHLARVGSMDQIPHGIERRCGAGFQQEDQGRFDLTF
jgi:hypothetical protein